MISKSQLKRLEGKVVPLLVKVPVKSWAKKVGYNNVWLWEGDHYRHKRTGTLITKKLFNKRDCIIKAMIKGGKIHHEDYIIPTEFVSVLDNIADKKSVKKTRLQMLSEIVAKVQEMSEGERAMMREVLNWSKETDDSSANN